MVFLSRVQEFRKRSLQKRDLKISMANPSASGFDESNRALSLHCYSDMSHEQELTASPSDKPAAFRPLRSILRQKQDTNANSRRRCTVTFTNDIHKISRRLGLALGDEVHSNATYLAMNDTTSSAQGDTSPHQSGLIQLQRKPKNENLRATAERLVAQTVIQLQRKARMTDLRAAAAANSPTRNHTSAVDIQTLDTMIQTLNLYSPAILSVKKQECDSQHCRTCTCSAQTGMVMCNVCEEWFLPSGCGWVSWDRAGNFCPECIGEAFIAIAAEEDEYDCTEGSDSQSC